MPSTIESSFFDKLLNPLSLGRANDDLVHTTTLEFCVYLLACTIIGAVTLGMPHLFHEAYHQYQRRKITESNPTGATVVLNPKTKKPAQAKATNPPNHVTFSVVPKPKETVVPPLPLDQIRPFASTEPRAPRDSSPVPTGSPTNPGTPPPKPEIPPRKVLGAARPTEEKAEVKELPKSIQCEYSQGKVDEIIKALNRKDIVIPKAEQIDLDAFSNSMIEDIGGAAGLAMISEGDKAQWGSNACAVICKKAVLSFLNHGMPTTEKAIYELICDGVKEYIEKGMEGLQEFSLLFQWLSSEEVKGINVIVPNSKDKLGEISNAQFRACEVTEEFQGGIEDAQFFPQFIEAVVKRAIDAGGRTSAVITIEAGSSVTLVMMIDENKQLWLFDSHGANGKGASLTAYKDARELSEYLQKHFFKNARGEPAPGKFAIKALNKQLA